MDELDNLKVYLVGGAVRDRLLDLPVTERDWVVVGATPELLLSKGYQQIGRDFPVFLHPLTHEEYALARTERKSGKGYTGFICNFSQNVTLEQDLIRRDLTINAIAMDENGELIDPYHGITDLERRVLTHISPAFREDPLRVLRVARFAARYHHLGFTISDETQHLMKQMVESGEINCLTAERVWKETEKALGTQDPQVYFQVLNHCDALSILFPNLSFTPRVAKALKRVVHLTEDFTTRFAVLLTQMQNSEQVEFLCTRLKVSKDYRKASVIVQKYVKRVDLINMLDAAQLLALFDGIDVWRNPKRLQQLIIASQSYDELNSEDQNYPQGNYLYNAYQIANSIDVKAIIARGMTGKKITAELQRLRRCALTNSI